MLSTFCSAGCGKQQPSLVGGKPLSHWLQALENADPKIRKEAVFKLGNVGPGDADAFSAVLRSLKDDDARVRCEAILALLKFGREAGQGIPILQKLKSDPDSKVREYAVRALEKLV